MRRSWRSSAPRCNADRAPPHLHGGARLKVIGVTSRHDRSDNGSGSDAIHSRPGGYRYNRYTAGTGGLVPAPAGVLSPAPNNDASRSSHHNDAESVCQSTSNEATSRYHDRPVRLVAAVSPSTTRLASLGRKDTPLAAPEPEGKAVSGGETRRQTRPPAPVRWPHYGRA